jgi:uncharacterized membrane protein YphA (DoxX/SURF4 family)
MKDRQDIVIWVLTLFVGFVFVQSLFFKFTYSPETQHIFGTLDQWAEDAFGLRGLFDRGGIFSAYVIGSVEGVASSLLLLGQVLRRHTVGAVGALIGLGVISGAIFFHLFTPLGTVIVNEELGVASDGGVLFAMACAVWISCAVILWLRRGALLGLLP